MTEITAQLSSPLQHNFPSFLKQDMSLKFYFKISITTDIKRKTIDLSKNHIYSKNEAFRRF